MVFFLTGATGFLGGELLVCLSKNPSVKRIYCLIRASSIAQAENRLRKVFALHDDPCDPAKIIPVVGDLADDSLPAVLGTADGLSDVNCIVHAAANTSFARIYDNLVENINVRGLDRVLTWAKTLRRLDLFTYVGTATICGKNIVNRVITEDESPDPAARHLVKYTYTKMVGETMVRAAFPESRVRIVRPSIIMGDSRGIIPRSNVMLWTLAASELLHLVPVNPEAKLDIIPVDYAAAAICQLIFSRHAPAVCHVSSGTAGISTPRQLTDAIAPYYRPAPPLAYVPVKMIHQMKNWTRGRLAPGSPLLSYREYLEYWESVFDGNKSKLRILFGGLEPYLHFIELSQVFDNTRLLASTTIGQSPPAHGYIAACVPFMKNIDVFEGALDP
jgi:thioester reductase-like protein